MSPEPERTIIPHTTSNISSTKPFFSVSYILLDSLIIDPINCAFCSLKTIRLGIVIKFASIFIQFRNHNNFFIISRLNKAHFTRNVFSGKINIYMMFILSNERFLGYLKLNFIALEINIAIIQTRARSKLRDLRYVMDRF